MSSDESAGQGECAPRRFGPPSPGHPRRATGTPAARARAGALPRRPPRTDAGMTTAEYALGTVAACGFAAVLWAVVHSSAVHHLIQSVVERALNLPF